MADYSDGETYDDYRTREAAAAYDSADYYDVRNSEDLVHTSPADAIGEYVELYLTPGCDTAAVIIGLGPLKLTAYRATDNEENDDGSFDCDPVGERTYSVEEIEAMMREYAPEWFDNGGRDGDV